VGLWALVSILMTCSGVALPLAIVLLVPAKANVDEARVRRLTRHLALATVLAVALVLGAAIYHPGLSPFASWVFLPLWFGLGMPVIMAKRPEAGLGACPKCNYPIPEEKQKEEVRCPECGIVSRPNRLFPTRVVSAGK
jgi:hypothetical protein